MKRAMAACSCGGRVAMADVVGDAAVLRQGPSPGTRVVTVGAAELFGTEFGAGK